MKLIILHITDLHVKDRITFFDYKVKSIINLLKNDNFSNNVLVLFSGDLAFSGKESQYNIVEDFINKIKDGLYKDGKKAYFSSCPGNHDRNFNEGEDLPPAEVKKVNTENYLNYINKYSYLLDNYNEFENGLDNVKRINESLSLYKFKFDEKIVKIYSLNNVCLSSFVPSGEENTDYNYENIFMPNDMLDIKRENEEYTFLLMHMPLRYFVRNTKNYLNNVCSKNIDLVFDGHVHDESITISNEGYVEITSSALYSNDVSGFSLLHLNENKINASVYIFDDEDKKYRVDSKRIPSVEFKEKKTTVNGFSVNKGFIDANQKIKIQEGLFIDIDEVFVFPSLSEKRYSINKEKRHVESFSNFYDFIKDKKLINIIGEESIGKTTFARQLFYYFIEKGLSPILCEGEQFESKSTNKGIKERIAFQINNSYLNRNAIDDYFEIPLSNRVLIIDNFKFVSTSLLEECAQYFDKIVFFSNESNDDLFTINTFPGLSSSILTIEPLFRNKREEMCKKIYEALCLRKEDIKDNISCEQFILSVEKIIDKMDVSYMVDPYLLIDISVKILLKIDIFTSGKNLSYQKQRYSYLINKALCEKNHDKCTPEIAERMLSDVAYFAYKNKINEIDIDVFETALSNEIDEYDSIPFKKIGDFVEVLIDAKLIKTCHDSQNAFRFHDMKVFAFYVGKYAMRKKNDGDETPINEIISRGIYSQLNFNILMSIAYSYDVGNIPNYFVTELYDEVCNDFVPKLQNLNGIKVFFLEQKQRISNIDETEKQEIRKKIAEDESKNREEYIENIDNYFYEKNLDDETKELIELLNKNQIVSSLLNSSDLLRAAQKKKLVEIAITLPNVVLDKYIDYVQRTLDEIYIKILNEIEKNNSQDSDNIIAVVDDFFDNLVSIVSATILSIYDVGSRALNNPIMNDRLVTELKENERVKKFQMPDIQRLMLLSFSKNENSFINETLKYLNEEKDSFNKNCAALIARRYCIDNYDYVRKKHISFLQKIQAIFGKNLLIEANKK